MKNKSNDDNHGSNKCGMECLIYFPFILEYNAHHF